MGSKWQRLDSSLARLAPDLVLSGKLLYITMLLLLFGLYVSRLYYFEFYFKIAKRAFQHIFDDGTGSTENH